MKRTLLTPNLNLLNLQFKKTILRITKDNNHIDFSKEDAVLKRLQSKLGKSKEEVSKMISKNLMDLLTMVPFSTEKD